jgi:hypothetical protein
VKVAYDYEADAWSLFCLLENVGEKHDRAGTDPQVLATLAQRLVDWLQQESPTWQPKYPIRKDNGQPAGPPRLP